jgi:hypothetical protein
LERREKKMKKVKKRAVKRCFCGDATGYMWACNRKEKELGKHRKAKMEIEN